MGKAQAARVYPFHNSPVPIPSKNRYNSRQSANPKYVSKPYEQMQHPGQRVQIDVKFVPDACIVGEAKGQKFYQYTVIDEYSRFRYLEAFEEHSSYTSTVFLEHMLKRIPLKVECVQTDNGQEFTKHLDNSQNLTSTLFEEHLGQLEIRHKLIKPYTPKYNGKVERSHRKDNEYFYATHSFYSFDDFAKQLQVHNYKYNSLPCGPSIGWLLLTTPMLSSKTAKIFN